MKESEEIKVNNNDNYNDSEILIIKILIVGDPGVGKSNFIFRYTKDKFSKSNLSTVGFESNCKEIEINKRKIIIQLWDSAGQNKYRAITKNLFKRVEGIIILYDITDKNSFSNVTNWIKSIKEENDNVQIALAGNKCDLNKRRVVEEEEAINLSRENQIIFMETSAKFGTNVMQLVNDFVENMINSDKFNDKISFNLQTISTSAFKTNLEKNEKCC